MKNKKIILFSLLALACSNLIKKEKEEEIKPQKNIIQELVDGEDSVQKLTEIYKATYLFGHIHTVPLSCRDTLKMLEFLPQECYDLFDNGKDSLPFFNGDFTSHWISKSGMDCYSSESYSWDTIQKRIRRFDDIMIVDKWKREVVGYHNGIYFVEGFCPFYPLHQDPFPLYYQGQTSSSVPKGGHHRVNSASKIGCETMTMDAQGNTYMCVPPKNYYIHKKCYNNISRINNRNYLIEK